MAAVNAPRVSSWFEGHVRAQADGSSAQPQWTSSLALLALHHLRTSADVQAHLKQHLAGIKVKRIGRNDVIDLDGSLRGWAWVDDTFSWVEPTSYALIALKKTGQRETARIQEAERLLLDRACTDGGWNYGNRKVRNLELTSMVPATALAVMALQDVPAAVPQLTRALDLLDTEASTKPSAMGLALTIHCFNIAARPAVHLADAILNRQQENGSWRGQVHLTALALLALQAHMGGTNVFKLQ
jgi:hypothetical protein